MKPDTSQAMRQLIDQIEQTIPFGLSEEELCVKTCVGCPKKLLDYLHGEIEHREGLLAAGDIPTLGDLNKLGRTSKKIYKALERNRLVPVDPR